MRVARGFFRNLGTVSAAIALLVTTASVASAFGLRAPQVVFNSGALQAYLNGQGETINCLTDQIDAQVWTTAVSGNSTFTLMIELTGNAGANSIGVYNASAPGVPPLFLIFPGGATTGWHATAHFSGGNLTVTLFDQNAVIQGQNFYAGVDPNGFGFYIQGPSGTFYSQDARNPGGAAQVLTYLGTGQNFGDWWECFEEFAFAQGDADFNDVVLLMQSVAPTPVDGTSWGRIKSLYRN